MSNEEKKEGVSVKELEGYAKKHRFEIFFCILFILASLFTLVFWGPTLSIFLAGVGGIVSVFMPGQIGAFSKKMAETVLSKEATVLLIVSIVALVAAIFLAPLIFLLIGLHAGKSMLHMARDASQGDSPPSA